MKIRALGLGAVALAVLGCGVNDDDRPPDVPKVKKIIPTDDRPAVTAASTPPPISGGTLTILADGATAVAADPDRDLVYVADLEAALLRRKIQLRDGDEPGRVVADSEGRAHVALRRGGAVATIDPATGEILGRRDVCGAPRGLAHDAATGLLHVACAGGELISMPASGGEETRRLNLGVDLRDVIVKGDRLWVSRFKSGEVMEVATTGAVTGRAGLSPVEQISFEAAALEEEPPGRGGGGRIRGPETSSGVEFTEVLRPMEPAGAWRMMELGDGVAVLHQYGFAGKIDVEPDDSVGIDGFPVDAYGGGGDGCSGIVKPGISTIDGNGRTGAGIPLAAGVLAVDAALSPGGRWVAVAHAGTHDPEAPLPSFEIVEDRRGGDRGGVGFAEAPGSFFSMGGVTIYELQQIALPPGQPGDGIDCRHPNIINQVDAQTTAVAFNPRMDEEAQLAGQPWVVTQSREPARLTLFADGGFAVQAEIHLDSESVYDTGHELFHRNTGAGIACASCHLEGGDDGRVWDFDPIGARRTQAMHVGLRGTAPFHWDGDMHDLNMLMEEVFVGRMGGARQSDPRQTALEEWVFELTPPAAIVAPSDPAAERGRAIFESAEAACSSCHAGPTLTNNQSYFVGTTEPGHALQVPSLVGVGYRAPFIHTGCAPTLEARFDPACGGGDLHGKTSHLSETEIGDLVAYLRSL